MSPACVLTPDDVVCSVTLVPPFRTPTMVLALMVASSSVVVTVGPGAGGVGVGGAVVVIVRLLGSSSRVPALPLARWR